MTSSTDPLDAGMIAARFRQGQRIRPTVDAVLTSLYRIGLVAADNEQRFSWRKAA